MLFSVFKNLADRFVLFPDNSDYLLTYSSLDVVRGDLESRVSRHFSPGRSIGDCGEEFRRRHVRSGLDVVKPRFPLTAAFATAFNSALHDVLAEAVVMGYMTKPRQFPSFHSGKKRFLGANECIYCGSYVIVGFVVLVGDLQ